MPVIRSFRLACAGLVFALLSGCVAYATRQIVHPTKLRGMEQPEGALQKMLGHGLHQDSLLTAHGIRIAWWRIDPGDYHLTGTARIAEDGHAVDLNFKMGSMPTLYKQPARGTIVLLHPWGMNGLSLFFWATPFAKHGYVALMPDLRGHGGTDDAPVGYGPREAADVVAWLRELDRRSPLPRPIVLFGISYGADVALFAAPQLDDAKAVIALEPYANAGAAIRAMPASGLMGHPFIARFMTAERMQRAVIRASRELGVDLDAVEPASALASSTACSLILRGEHDRIVSRDAVRELVAQNPRAQHVEVSEANHLTLGVESFRLAAPLIDWLDALDDDGACPPSPTIAPLVIPADGTIRF